MAKHKSYSQAAKSLNVSRSYLSKAIKDLEEEMGHKLFKRNTRFIDFTDFGEVFFKKCVHHIEALESIFNQSKSSSSIKAKIRISLAGAYGEDIIAPLISNFLLKNPHVKAELIFSTELTDITKQDFDIAFRTSSKKPSKGHSIQVSERTEIICASPEYLKKFGTPLKPIDIKKHNCIIGTNSNWTFQTQKSISNIKVDGNFTSTNARAIKSAALQGLGICKLPSAYISKEIQNKELIPLLSPYTPHSIPIWAIIPSKKLISPEIKFILKQFNEQII